MKEEQNSMHELISKLAEIRTNGGKSHTKDEWTHILFQLTAALNQVEILIRRQQEAYLKQGATQKCISWDPVRNYGLVISRDMENLNLLLQAYLAHDHHPKSAYADIENLIRDLELRVKVICQQAAHSLQDASSALVIRHELGELDASLFEITRILAPVSAANLAQPSLDPMQHKKEDSDS